MSYYVKAIAELVAPHGDDLDNTKLERVSSGSLQNQKPVRDVSIPCQTGPSFYHKFLLHPQNVNTFFRQLQPPHKGTTDPFISR